ncbi:MAG: hypothetical protein Q8M92_09220 [Candidatus Subteraquimicrobiales bacterium]|nr:hypothetical protein [Candidatus Subteraquimicrobiales bacterium]
MYRERRCRLCGAELPNKPVEDCSEWEVMYCCYICYLTDLILPPVENTDNLFGLSNRVINMRYRLIVSGDSDIVFKEKFEEEEDMIMREDNDGE